MRGFVEKELAPYAQDIDKNNSWDGLRQFWRKLGDQGLLGITAPGLKIFNFNFFSNLVWSYYYFGKLKNIPMKSPLLGNNMRSDEKDF